MLRQILGNEPVESGPLVRELLMQVFRQVPVLRIPKRAWTYEKGSAPKISISAVARRFVTGGQHLENIPDRWRSYRPQDRYWLVHFHVSHRIIQFETFSEPVTEQFPNYFDSSVLFTN